MSIPQIQSLAKKIVKSAIHDGTLSQLTPRLIRNDIENQLDLEPGSLDTKEHRAALKTAIAEAQENSSDEPPEEKPASKVKSKGKSKSRKSEPSDTSPGKKRKAEDSESSARKKKKQVPTDTSKKAEKPKKVTQSFKSAEIVPPSSDVEEANHDSLFSAEENTPTPRKAARKKPLRLSSGDEETRDEPSSSKRESENTSAVDAGPAVPAVPDNDEDLGSESELSVLIDESPKNKNKTKNKEKKKDKDASSSSKAGNTKSKSTKSSTSKDQKRTKDEETIKRLKTLINACGVRKVWSRLFKSQNIEDSPTQQIQLLRDMLKELGMPVKGRMSMEQARAVRERRELEEELAEVQEFEKEVLRRESRGARAKVKGGGEGEGEEKESPSSSESEASAEKKAEKEGEAEEENEKPVKPAKRKYKNARQSIMAFLGDQSDSE